MKAKLSGSLFDLKDSAYRIALHIPVGIATALLVLSHWAVAIIFGAGFLAYELSEENVITDDAYKDIRGWLWGLFIGGIILWLI